MASQQATDSSKKRSAFWVPALCILLIVSIVLSAVFLGGILRRFFGGDANVIALVPPEGVEAAGEETAAFSRQEAMSADAGQSDAADGASVLNRTAGNTTYTVSQPDKAKGEAQVYDNAQIWNSETRVDLFKNRYDGTVESDNGEKVIAPGTSNFYDFTLKNNGKIPLDYEISLEVAPYSETEDAVIPLEWRLLTADGTAVSDWREHTERIEVLRQATLDIRHQDRYEIEWRWAFEQDESADKMDTRVGNLAVEQPLGVTATIYVRAEQSTSWDAPSKNHGATPKTGDDANLLLYAALLTASACGLLILFAAAKRRKKDGDVMNG